MGIARALIDAGIEFASGVAVEAYAYAKTTALYEKFGCQSVASMTSLDGTVKSIPAAPPGSAQVRTLDTSRYEDVFSLDLKSCPGRDRSRALSHWAQAGEIIGYEIDGRVNGYALLRHFFDGALVIGPVVAPDDQTAVALVHHALSHGRRTMIRTALSLDHPMVKMLLNAGLEVPSRTLGSSIMRRESFPGGEPDAREYALVYKIM